MSILIFQFVPPPLPYCVRVSVLYVCVLFLPWKSAIWCLLKCLIWARCYDRWWRYSGQHSLCPQEVHILVENYFCHLLLGFVIISPLHVFPAFTPIFSYLLLNFFFSIVSPFHVFFLPCVLSCLLLNFFLILFCSSLLPRKFSVLFPHFG